MKKEYDIFISYRREGGKEYARNLTSELVSRGFHPFLDFDELVDGKFDKRITDAIESAPVFMFILSPGSLDRCVNEEDWVRKEILHAVKHHRHIVPVDIDKQFTSFPADKDFPQEIKDALGQYQFSQIQTETLYKESIDKMVRNRIQPAIEEYQRERQKAAGASGAEIHIETDMDCHVQRFHKDMIVAKADEENVIRLGKGKHKLQFIAVDNPKVKDSCEYKVDDVSESDYIAVFLQEKAGIVSAETENLEKLQQEKEKLSAEVTELGNKLSETESFAEKRSGEIAKLKERLNLAEKELSEKNSEIVSLKTTLSDVKAILANTRTELEKYKSAEKEAMHKAEEERKRVEEEKRQGLFKVGNVEFKMIYVEGETFKMGSDNGCADEKPVHDVTLSDYFIGETVVTQALWKAVMNNNPSGFKGDNLPVENVSWEDCQEFIRKLNNRVQDQLKGRRFAFPTEAQWEFAARGGKKRKGYLYSGSNTIDDVAWYEGNSSEKTHPVKQKRANELGLYDMSGNVLEWCQNWYGSYPSSPQTDPVGPSSRSYRVIRGGSWSDLASGCLSAYRNVSAPDDCSNDLGLRLVLLF